MRRGARAAWLLFRGSHPEPVVAVTLIVTALALAAHRGPAMSALMGAAVLAGQLFIGWTNDLIDADLDRAAGRTDKPLASGKITKQTFRLAVAGAAVLVVPLSLLTGRGSGIAHLTAVLGALAYNLGLKKTPFSVVPYALAFGLVPAFVTLGPPITHYPPLWATAAGALLGAGGHFTQTLPDLDTDRQAGINGLPHRLGARASALTAAALMAAAAAAVALGPAHPQPLLYLGLAIALMLLGAIVVAAATDHWKLAFRLTLVTAAAVVATVVAAGVAF
ncbi:MAG TPA: UbiA family prenyltransferase [Candidatus Dormibacteraeota bacterium]